MNSKQALSRATPYETAKLLADREDMMTKGYSYPEMTSGYPKMRIKEGAGLFGFLCSVLP